MTTQKRGFACTGMTVLGMRRIIRLNVNCVALVVLSSKYLIRSPVILVSSWPGPLLGRTLGRMTHCETHVT